MSDENKRLVIVVTRPASDDRASVAFTIANASLSNGFQTAIFLSSDGVELSRAGACDLAEFKPIKPLGDLIESFVKNGGTLWACTPCFQARGLKQEETVPNTIVTGSGPMLEWIANGASTLCF